MHKVEKVDCRLDRLDANNATTKCNDANTFLMPCYANCMMNAIMQSCKCHNANDIMQYYRITDIMQMLYAMNHRMLDFGVPQAHK